MSVPPEDSESFALLEQSDEQQLKTSSYEVQERTKDTRTNILQWMSALLSIFLLVDMFLYLAIYHRISSLGLTIQEELEFRSPYTGLDDLYRTGLINASYHAPIVSMPRIAAQVSSVEQTKVFPEDEHRFLSRLGTVSPPDRHVLVTSSIRTLLQFRAMDFGMERCALAMRLPFSEEDHSLVLGNGSFEVCEIDVNHMLDTRTLCWANRPACRRRLRTFAAAAGEDTILHDFPCAWGSLPTYEVSCATGSPDCMLDVWGGSSEQWGFVLYQYQTLGQV